jgi:uncharacterized membrane protein AbrB (regulator of aidB expression)
MTEGARETGALAFLATAAATGGLAASAAGIPGGLIFGSVLGAAAGSLRLGRRVVVPSWLRDAAFIGVGAQVGMRVTRDTLGPLGEPCCPRSSPRSH